MRLSAKDSYKAGLRCIAEGDLDGAIRGFQQALQADSAYYLAHLGWSQALDRKGDVDAAIVQAELAIELAPEEPLAFASLSRLHQQKGRIAEAEAAMAESMRLQKG
jgi:tetratricopeptide (TPR) repeat protein